MNTNVLGSTTSKEENSKSTNKDKDATTKTEKKQKSSGVFGWIKNKVGMTDEVHYGDKLR